MAWIETVRPGGCVDFRFELGKAIAGGEVITGLDGLRAIAFLMVFAFHTRHLEFGWLGVQLFFVLSGFLITDILLRMKDSLSGKQFFTRFYGRRFLRIFPLYYFYLALVAGLVLLIPILRLNLLKSELGDLFGKQIWPAAFYVYDFFHASAPFQGTPFFTHLWSLSVEEQFYLIWPLILFVTPREQFRKVCLIGIGLGPVLRLAISLLYRSQLFPFLLNDPQLAVNVLPFSQIDAFAMGAYISRFDLPRPRLQLLALTLAIPTIGLFSEYVGEGSITPSLGYDLPLAGMYKEVWGYSLLNYLFVILIYCTARTKQFGRFLNSRPLKYLGKISYGLYVYHFAIIAILEAVFRKYGLDYPIRSSQMFGAALSLTIMVASLSFFLLEKPLTDLKDRFFLLPGGTPRH